MDYREPMSGDTFAAFRAGDHVHLNMNGWTGTLSFVGARFLAAMLTDAAGPEPTASVVRGQSATEIAVPPLSATDRQQLGEIDPVARQQALSAENSDRLTEKDREIEELKAKCHPLRCGHCSCFIESRGVDGDKCSRIACFPNYGPSMRAEIERLTVQVTELQIANTREIEVRRAAEKASSINADWARGEREAREDAERRVVAAEKECGESKATMPVPMILDCPFCHSRHIDVGELATTPHRTHACQNPECGRLWAPAVVATVGVRFLPGCKNDA